MANNQLFEVSLKAIIKNKTGEVLILKESSAISNHYDFPGGRIQEGEENLEYWEVLSREIAEETGLGNFTINRKPCAVGRHSRKAGQDSQIYVLWLFFEVEYHSGEVNISGEHVGFDWVKLEEIDSTKYFVRGALDGIKNYLGR